MPRPSTYPSSQPERATRKKNAPVSIAPSESSPMPSPLVIEDPEISRLLQKHWLTNRELCLRLGVKSHTARQVVLGRWNSGRKPTLLFHPTARFQTPFLETPLSELLGRSWVDDFDLLNSDPHHTPFLPDSLKRRIKGKRLRHKVCPFDLHFKLLRPRWQLCYHPVMRPALQAYMAGNGISTRSLSLQEAHWISCNELMHRLQVSVPSVTLVKSTLLSQTLQSWFEDPNLEIEVHYPHKVVKKPARDVIGFRQKDSGGLPGWWIDVKAFNWVHQTLSASTDQIHFLGGEENQHYQTVRKIAQQRASADFTMNYIYVQGLPIAEFWYQRLQEYPEGYVMYYRFQGKPRRCTIHPESLLLGRRLGVNTLYLDPYLKRTLIALLHSGIKIEHFYPFSLSPFEA